MRVKYDQSVDILRVLLNNEAIDDSDEIAPGLIVDYDAAGKIVGFEILDASTAVDNPLVVQLEVAGADPRNVPGPLVGV